MERSRDSLLDELNVKHLMAGIAKDAQTLIEQELRLAKAEIREQWKRYRDESVGLIVGAWLLGVAGFFILFALGLGMAEWFSISSWVSFAILAVIVGAAGYFAWTKAFERMGQIGFFPRRTVESIRENVKWLKQAI